MKYLLSHRIFIFLAILSFSINNFGMEDENFKEKKLYYLPKKIFKKIWVYKKSSKENLRGEMDNGTFNINDNI